jgi:hypothetical protein
MQRGFQAGGSVHFVDFLIADIKVFMESKPSSSFRIKAARSIKRPL